MSGNIIYVYAHWVGMQIPSLVGSLRTQHIRGKEIFDFTYDDDWLASGHAVAIDPHLGLYSGPHHVLGERKNFGVFLDSSPDRWGRTIMERRAADKARKADVPIAKLFGADYLLGVHDGSRFGALRFTTDLEGAFLVDQIENTAPPLTSLRELEQASLLLENLPADDVKRTEILRLLAPGASLGGSRPKASVIDDKGQMWIAKFPSAADDSDVAAWEFVSNTLAKKCGITVPEVRLEKFSDKFHTLLSKRFDRTDQNERIHAASAMTLLGRVDGDDYNSNVSYLDVAEFCYTYTDETADQLKQLWMRVMFNVLISNTDDHLRNHSFLLTNTGWRLAPAYDVNPNPFGTGLHLNISESDNSLDTDLVISVASKFRVDELEARRIASEMSDIVSGWQEVAKNIGIQRSELLQMSGAFRRYTAV